MIDRPHLRTKVVKELKKHVGKTNAISAANLLTLTTGEIVVPSLERNQTRLIRSIIRDIRRDKELAIISGNGYWVAESDEELTAYAHKLLCEAARKYGLARSLSKVPVSRMVKQFNLNFSDEEKNNEH